MLNIFYIPSGIPMLSPEDVRVLVALIVIKKSSGTSAALQRVNVLGDYSLVRLGAATAHYMIARTRNRKGRLFFRPREDRETMGPPHFYLE